MTSGLCDRVRSILPLEKKVADEIVSEEAEILKLGPDLLRGLGKSTTSSWCQALVPVRGEAKVLDGTLCDLTTLAADGFGRIPSLRESSVACSFLSVVRIVFARSLVVLRAAFITTPLPHSQLPPVFTISHLPSRVPHVRLPGSGEEPRWPHASYLT